MTDPQLGVFVVWFHDCDIKSRKDCYSRRCDEILSLDYFELMEAKGDVENDVENVLKMECKTESCASSKLQYQFPNHETLLNQLRTCVKIVTGKISFYHI